MWVARSKALLAAEGPNVSISCSGKVVLGSPAITLRLGASQRICAISGEFLSIWSARRRNSFWRSGMLPMSSASCCSCSSLLLRWNCRFCSSHSTSLISAARSSSTSLRWSSQSSESSAASSRTMPSLGRASSQRMRRVLPGRTESGEIMAKMVPHVFRGGPIVVFHNSDSHNSRPPAGYGYCAPKFLKVISETRLMAKKSIFKSLYVQVLIAIALGVTLGHFYPSAGADMKPLGDAFIKLIKMIIAPIIFCTIVVGIAGMEDMKKVGKTGGYAVLYFEVVSTLALIIGLIIVNVVQPGSGMHVDPTTLDTKGIAAYTAPGKLQNTTEFLLAIIPSSMFDAFA